MTAEDLPAVAPVFALGDTVLFPRTHVDLHVFEPRYRAMVEDARRSDGMIAIALADGEDYHAIGTVGRIRHLERTDDGRFHLRLVGAGRVKLVPIPSPKPYALARCEPRAELEITVADAPSRKLELLAMHAYLAGLVDDRSVRSLVVDPDLPLEVAVNHACAHLPLSAAIRQSLLEEDELGRREQQVLKVIEKLLVRLLSGRRERDPSFLVGDVETN